MRADDIAGLTPELIARKFSLPQVPTMMADVNLPAGTKLQASVASDILKGSVGGGGGVQFQIANPPQDPATFGSWFSNARSLK